MLLNIIIQQFNAVILLFIVQRRFRPPCARVGDQGGGTTSTKSRRGEFEFVLLGITGKPGGDGDFGSPRWFVSPAGTRSVSGNIHLGALPAVAVAMWPLSHSARGVTAAGR